MRNRIKNIISKENREHLDILYYCALGLFLIYMISTHLLLKVDLDFLWKPLFLLCIALLSIRECMNPELRLKELIALLFMMIIVSLIFRIAIGPSANSLIMVFVFAFTARKMKFSNIARFAVIISGVMLFIIILCSELGIIENYVMHDEREREFLGFRYALKAPALFFNIIGLFVYIKKQKISLIQIALLTIINIFLYQKTDSRLSFFLGELILLFAFIMKKWPKLLTRRKVLCILVVFSFLLGSLGICYLTKNYNPSIGWQSKLNSVLAGRLYYSQKSLEKYGFSILGNKEIEWTGNGLDKEGKPSNQEYSYVDSYYIQVLQRYGLLVLLSILLICTISMIKIYKEKDYYLLFLLGFKAAHCIIDDSSMLLEFNTFWIAIGTMVFRHVFTDGYIFSYYSKKKTVHIGMR
ncbi:hypothetical protein JNO48_07395 [Clostridiales bacterium]|nr:hypothetical protein JNO48_07395 [Clostridiales bacterium]